MEQHQCQILTFKPIARTSNRHPRLNRVFEISVPMQSKFSLAFHLNPFHMINSDTNIFEEINHARNFDATDTVAIQ